MHHWNALKLQSQVLAMVAATAPLLKSEQLSEGLTEGMVPFGPFIYLKNHMFSLLGLMILIIIVFLFCAVHQVG